MSEKSTGEIRLRTGLDPNTHLISQTLFDIQKKTAELIDLVIKIPDVDLQGGVITRENQILRVIEQNELTSYKELATRAYELAYIWAEKAATKNPHFHPHLKKY